MIIIIIIIIIIIQFFTCLRAEQHVPIAESTQTQNNKHGVKTNKPGKKPQSVKVIQI
jgi:hypothetical protein